jgi:PAS domain S-box-containing protein
MTSERGIPSAGWLVPVSFAVAYFAGAELGHALSVSPGHLATIWPPSGLYLAVLLFTPSKHWPRLLGAAALADVASAGLHGDAVWLSASFWLAHTLEAVAGASLLRSLFPLRFAVDRLKNTLALVLVGALVSAPIGAVVGALTVRIAFGAGFGQAWLTWWIADLVGILLFCPLVLAFKDPREVPPVPQSRWRTLEACLFVLTTAVVVTVVFGVVPDRPLRFAVYPCLLWGAVRFGMRGASGGLTVVSLLAVALTLNHWGAFSGANVPPLSGMHVVQLFLSVTALSFLSLAAVIVERDHASHELSQREQELRDVIDTIPTGVGAAFPDGSMEFVNRRWAEYSGMEDSSGSHWQAAVHPDDLARHMEKWRASLESGEPFENELRYRRGADGRYRWFVVRAVPLRDAQGRIRKWYGVSTDIDHRKRSEAYLGAEKRILEMVARGSSLSDVLDALCRLVEEQAPGVLASVLLLDGDRLRHGGAPSLPKAYTEAIDGAAIGPTAGSCGTAAYRAQQVIVSDIATDPLWAEYRDLALPHSLRACWSTPICSSDGNVIATFAMYYREPRSPSGRDQAIIEQITHLAGIAIQRKLDEAKLQDSEDKWRGVFENNPIMFFVVDAGETVVSVNPSGAEQLGYTIDELIGRSVLDLFYEADRAAVRTHIAACFERLGHARSWELRKVRKDGRMINVRETARAMRRTGREPVVLVVCEDITERKRAEAALYRAQTELAHVTRVTTLGQLAASIAHEVNQPLAAIVADATASLNWLEGASPDLDQVREALTAIVKDGHRAAEIIQRIRQLATKTEPRNARLNINDVVRDVVSLMRAELQRHDIALVPELAAALPLVFGDRVQLQQVLLNLVINAIDAMAPVTSRPRELIIRSTPNGDEHITVAVHDTGVGIDRNHVDSLFNAFFTTKPGGMGMGLSISRSIVEAHGGRLWATANSPHGATFHFSLPVDVGGHGDPQVPAHARNVKRATSPA